MAPPRKPKSQLSRTAKYYRDNPEAAERKKATDNAVNRRTEQKEKRAEAGRKRYQAEKKGAKLQGKDYDHASDSFIGSSENRGKPGEGNRKKKSSSKRVGSKRTGKR